MRLILVLQILLCSGLVRSQQYQTSQGQISFFAEAPIENIAATNKNVLAAVDLLAGEITVRLDIVHFEFKKPLMKTHFNDKYLESKQFPEATFHGKLIGLKSSQEQQVMASGKLTIHGQTKEVQIPVTMQVNKYGITLSSAFVLLLTDFGIRSPRIFWSNITEDVEVKVNLMFSGKDH